MKFSECLIRLRKENNFSQDALAELLNVTRQTISKWENGDCMLDAAKLIRLSEIFHISIDELCGKIIQSSPSASGADGGAAAEPEHADKKVGFYKDFTCCCRSPVYWTGCRYFYRNTDCRCSK